MCSPVTPLPLTASSKRAAIEQLGLDQLGMLALHPRASAQLKETFAQVLTTWVHDRVRRLIGRWAQPAEREDVASDFIVRCYTRHLPAWSDVRCALSSYLYTRLRCEIVDHQRNVCRRAGRYLDIVDVDIAVDARDVEQDARDREKEARLALLDTLVDRLPRRRRMVLKRSLSGETLHAIGREKKVSHSTLSRERSLALATLQEAVRKAA